MPERSFLSDILQRVAAGEKLPDINGANARIAEILRAQGG